MSTAPIPNYEASWEWLQRFHKGRPVVVTGITLDKKSIPTDTFGSDEKTRFLAWVAACAAMPANIYFSVGEPLKAVTKKMERADIKAVHYLHVDIDPRTGEDIPSEQARILASLQNPPAPLPPPTGIVFSGGGYQGYWLLDAPLPVDGSVEVAEDLKRFNLQIERTLGADNCHDVSRIMRVPGTVNKPDKKKVEKGRVESLAEVVEWHAERVYRIDQFTKASLTPSVVTGQPSPTVSINPSSVKRLRHISELGATASDTLQQEIVSGPLDPVKWNFHESRNEWQFWVTCELVRAGVDDETIYAVLTDRNFSISKTIFEHHDGTARPNPEKYAIRQVTEARKEVGVVKPKVFVPDGKRQHIECAAELGPLLRANGVYRRGRTLMVSGPDGHLEPVKGPRAVTMLEQVAVFMAWREDKRGSGKFNAVPTLLPKETASVLAESDELIGAVPGITVVSRWPLLIEENGQLVDVTGYHERTGIYVLPDAPAAESVAFDDAARDLLGLLRDFDFREPADQARAVMAIIKPALNASGMLRSGRVPIDVIEKDQSQAGGGYMAKVIHSIYRCDRPGLIGQTNGGVGSVREAIHTKLIEGHQFIQLDNWKGMLNEPALEIALTENSIDCRMPGVKGVSVDPRQTCFLMTSNGAELTEDLANRANIIRIAKRQSTDGQVYQFHPWAEGGLLEHVESRQPHYLGCVFAVLRRWHEQGKRLADDNGQHDFRAWARASRYIAQSVLGLADPLAEYRKVQREKATPAMTWLRKVTLAVVKAGAERRPLKANELLAIIIDHDDIDVPGLTVADRHTEDEDTKRKALQGIGKRLGSAFAGATEEAREHGVKVRTITVDGKPVSRIESPGKGERTDKTYIVGAFDTLPDYSSLGEGEGKQLPF